MTILILTHSYPDGMNRYRGNFVREQAVALSSLYNVIVVYFKVDYSAFAPFRKYSFDKISDGNIIQYNVVTGRSFPVINQLKYFRDTFRFIQDEILKNIRPDIVHCHLAYPAGFLGTLISNRLRIPALLTEHTSIRKYYRSPVHKFCVKYALKRMRIIVSVSTSLKHEILEVCNTDIRVIPNVVNTGSFTLSEKPDTGKINIGFLGNMNNRNKGLDLLLNAVASIDHRQIILHIGGKGVLMKEFAGLSEKLGLHEICRFYGEILSEKKQEFYSSLDFFVLPSRYETFGIVLVEAMSSGLPVVAAKCGGPEDIVTPESGILVEKDNPVMLAEALSTMLASYKLFDRKKIKELAEQKFGQGAFLDRIAVVYNEILLK